MDDAVRKAKEAFVTGHNGGNIVDITFLVLSMALCTITSHLLLAYKLNRYVYFCCDILLTLIIPLLLCLYTDWSFLFVVGQLWLLFFIYMNYPFFSWDLPSSAMKLLSNSFNIRSKALITIDNDQNNTPHTNIPSQPPQSAYIELATSPTNSWVNNTLKYHIPSISRLRMGLFVLTAVCILGVDFHIFPRYNAKTEEYGTGLMDIGVGGFLFCNTLVHPLARGVFNNAKITFNSFNFDQIATSIINTMTSTTTTGTTAIATTKTITTTTLFNHNIFSILNQLVTITTPIQMLSFHKIIIKPIQGILPLVFVGLARLIVLSFVNYQSHVSEYGVHWNFFFTLASVMILCSLFHYISLWITLHDEDNATTTNNTNNNKNNNDGGVLHDHDNNNNNITNKPNPSQPQQHRQTSMYTLVIQSLLFIFITFLLGMVTLLIYESLLLSTTNLDGTTLTYKQWIFGPDRNGFFAQNKEGICSLFGYFALALIAMSLGRLLQLIQFVVIVYYHYQYWLYSIGKDIIDKKMKSRDDNNNINTNNDNDNIDNNNDNTKNVENQNENISTKRSRKTISTITNTTKTTTKSYQLHSTTIPLSLLPQIDHEVTFTLQTNAQVILSRIQGIITIIIAVMSWFVTIWLRDNVDNISRRLCNVSFCIWTVHIATLLLGIVSIPDMLYYLRFNPNNKHTNNNNNTNNENHVNIDSTVQQQQKQEQQRKDQVIPQDLNNRYTNPWSYNIDMILSIQHYKQLEEDQQREFDLKNRPKTLVDLLYNQQHYNKNPNNATVNNNNNNNNNSINNIQPQITHTNTNAAVITHQVVGNNTHNLTKKTISNTQTYPNTITTTTNTNTNRNNSNGNHSQNILRTTTRDKLIITSIDGSHVPDIFNPQLAPQHRFVRPKHRQTTVINEGLYHNLNGRLSMRPMNVIGSDDEDDNDDDSTVGRGLNWAKNYSKRQSSRTRSNIINEVIQEENEDEDNEEDEVEGVLNHNLSIETHEKDYHGKNDNELTMSHSSNIQTRHTSVNMVKTKTEAINTTKNSLTNAHNINSNNSSTTNTILSSLPQQQQQQQQNKSFFSSLPPNVTTGINSNALKYFLVTNACTGITNMSMVTMDQDDQTAFIILALYLIISYLITTMVPIGYIITTTLKSIKSFVTCQTDKQNESYHNEITKSKNSRTSLK